MKKRARQQKAQPRPSWFCLGFTDTFWKMYENPQARATRRGPPGPTITICKEILDLTNKINEINCSTRLKPLCSAAIACVNNAKALCRSKRTRLGTRRAHNARTTLHAHNPTHKHPTLRAQGAQPLRAQPSRTRLLNNPRAQGRPRSAQ